MRSAQPNAHRSPAKLGGPQIPASGVNSVIQRALTIAPVKLGQDGIEVEDPKRTITYKKKSSIVKAAAKHGYGENMAKWLHKVTKSGDHKFKSWAEAMDSISVSYAQKVRIETDVRDLHDTVISHLDECSEVVDAVGANISPVNEAFAVYYYCRKSAEEDDTTQAWQEAYDALRDLDRAIGRVVDSIRVDILGKWVLRKFYISGACKRIRPRIKTFSFGKIPCIPILWDVSSYLLTRVRAVGFNIHVRSDGSLYAGSSWLEGIHGFSMNQEDLHEVNFRELLDYLAQIPAVQHELQGVLAVFAQRKVKDDAKWSSVRKPPPGPGPGPGPSNLGSSLSTTTTTTVGKT
jgi:hypothetical protein